ncbi:hypothetical protein D3C87_1659820 [compost metagenome]
MGTLRKVSRFFSNGSGEKKKCGVCSIASFGSFRNQPRLICRKERVGTWSASKMAMYSPLVTFSASFRLPALA